MSQYIARQYVSGHFEIAENDTRAYDRRIVRLGRQYAPRALHNRAKEIT